MFFRERGFAGATVVRGMAGFGASARLHTGRVLRLSTDLPVIVEVVEEQDRVQEVLPELDTMIGGGLVTMEKTLKVPGRVAEARALAESHYDLRSGLRELTALYGALGVEA